MSPGVNRNGSVATDRTALRGRPADDLPAAGTLHGIDAGLRARRCATEPAGTRVRGVARRGMAIRGVDAPM